MPNEPKSWVNPPDVFAVHRWRPITKERASAELADMAATVDEPSELKAKVRTLDDGRTEVVYHAYCKPLPGDFDGSGDDIGPWLMLIADLELNKQVWLVRTDVTLADS